MKISDDLSPGWQEKKSQPFALDKQLDFDESVSMQATLKKGPIKSVKLPQCRQGLSLLKVDSLKPPTQFIQDLSEINSIELSNSNSKQVNNKAVREDSNIYELPTKTVNLREQQLTQATVLEPRHLMALQVPPSNSNNP